jgi:hypothetical protein
VRNAILYYAGEYYEEKGHLEFVHSVTTEPHFPPPPPDLQVFVQLGRVIPWDAFLRLGRRRCFVAMTG